MLKVLTSNMIFNLGLSFFVCRVLSGLLSGTLHTFHEASCDGESMKMSCPPGMLVSIQFAQYGRQVPSSEMCPNTEQNDESNRAKSWRRFLVEDTNCLATTSLTVSRP